MKGLIGVESIKQIPIVKKLLSETNPVIRYKTYKLSLDKPEKSLEE